MDKKSEVESGLGPYYWLSEELGFRTEYATRYDDLERLVNKGENLLSAQRELLKLSEEVFSSIQDSGAVMPSVPIIEVSRLYRMIADLNLIIDLKVSRQKNPNVS